MLAISSLRSTTLSAKNENPEQMESFSPLGNEELSDFSDKNLLESIDFDDLFGGINDGDVLPDLEMDPELLAELSVTRRGDESEMNTSVSNEKVEDNPRKEEEDKLSSGSGVDSSLSTRGEEIVSKRDDSSSMVLNPLHKEGDKGRKSSSTQTKNNQGKRKVKVDWTPELHRRFVQAVEQLGVDKAVPSRILELMGIDCLTRHNIASHLQKYRSHRKHLLAREAEAASWSQRRQMYGVPAAMGVSSKRDMNPWHVPTIGFPPVAPLQHPACRPLHVWGHPSMDQSHIHIWPKHLSHSPPPPSLPPHAWAPPPREPSFWHHHHHRVPNGLMLPGPGPGAHCFPQSLPATRFATPPVPGIPSQGMYKVDPSAPGIGIPTTGQPESAHHHQPNFDCHPGQPESGHHHQPKFDCHPSKESIDAAIGDVLSKPWLPLPLGLKPPSLDGVLVELHRQGVSSLPSTTCS